MDVDCAWCASLKFQVGYLPQRCVSLLQLNSCVAPLLLLLLVHCDRSSRGVKKRAPRCRRPSRPLHLGRQPSYRRVTGPCTECIFTKFDTIFLGGATKGFPGFTCACTSRRRPPAAAPVGALAQPSWKWLRYRWSSARRRLSVSGARRPSSPMLVRRLRRAAVVRPSRCASAPYWFTALRKGAADGSRNTCAQ